MAALVAVYVPAVEFGPYTTEHVIRRGRPHRIVSGPVVVRRDLYDRSHNLVLDIALVTGAVWRFSDIRWEIVDGVVHVETFGIPEVRGS